MLRQIGLICTASRSAANFALASMYHTTDFPPWVDVIFLKISSILKPTADQSVGTSLAADSEVPMDFVTSQMLSWMIVNCEDSRSVDTALQAIAGGSEKLPQGPLGESGATQLVAHRLVACFQDPHSERCRLRDPSMLDLAICYSRSSSLLMGKYYKPWDRWSPS
jgi:hypothetical protein